jgi:N-acetylglutamate synthase-like GNAT family acetyltransferase
MTPPPHLIRRATEDDDRYIISLAKRNTDALGFLPRPALDYYTLQGGVLIGEENADEAGFVVRRKVLSIDTRCSAILQACVQLDARRRALGLALVAQAAADAAAEGRSILQCWCAADLEANDFWRAAGFKAITTRPGGRARSRTHVLWRLPLHPDVTPADLSALVRDPRRGPAGLWLQAAATPQPTPTQLLLWPPAAPPSDATHAPRRSPT